MVSNIRNDPAARTLSVDSGKMIVRSVITTAQPDRVGDVVIPTGLKNVEDYLINPVVLWAHDRLRVPPIGLCEWLDVQPHRVVAQTRFAQDVRFAEDVFRLYEQGVLRGWSIGFLPRKATPIRKGNGTSLEVREWDLLEYSAVPIPENPGALTIALQKGFVKDPTLRDWLARVPEDRGGRVWRTHPLDVLRDLYEPEHALCSE
ncbi:hypothetical protein BH11PLA2_BH11PLA2_21700 [soil metagenome]